NTILPRSPAKVRGRPPVFHHASPTNSGARTCGREAAPEGGWEGTALTAVVNTTMPRAASRGMANWRLRHRGGSTTSPCPGGSTRRFGERHRRRLGRRFRVGGVRWHALSTRTAGHENGDEDGGDDRADVSHDGVSLRKVRIRQIG